MDSSGWQIHQRSPRPQTAFMGFHVDSRNASDLCFRWLTFWQVLVFNGVLSLRTCRHVSTM